MMGSSAVRWLHTRRDPGEPLLGAGGGVPRTASRMPVRRYVWRTRCAGTGRLMRMRRTAMAKPTGR
uniref:Predicted protein n=1 Tax=Hordeum vulgare subsp. vulgare TaxID=112509 RepID=F2DSB3_HORVV|nr:predicted protein [Hordeum vulgare subsp. vulgare]